MYYFFSHSTFSGAVHACNDYLNRFTESLKRNFKEFKEILHKFIETYKTIISRLTETFEKMSEPFLGVLNQASDLAFAVAEYVLDFLKIHETEIRDALVGVSGYIQGIQLFYDQITRK